MLRPEFLFNCADDYAFLYSQLESDICADIARRLARTGRFTATAAWQVEKLKEARAAYEAILKQLGAIDRTSDRLLRSTILDAARVASKFDDSIYLAAGLTPKNIAASKAMQDIIMAGVKKTKGVMRNLTMTTANTASKAFENALDRAYMQVQSGAFSFNQSLRMMINDLGKQGYQKIAYPSGGIVNLDSAARSALLTGLNQTTAQLQLARCSELGTDLVEVTAHIGARPTHAVWQGGIYSLSGTHPKYPDFVASTGYGTGAGLCGWNCYHSFFPFFEGISEPAYSAKSLVRPDGKSNEQVYKESQKQRGFERLVRDARRECVTYNAAMEAAADQELRDMIRDDFNAAAVKLKRLEEKLRAFCKETNRTMYSDRMQVYGYNHRVSSKASQANRRAKARS